ncbi:hypothetical protein [Kurthia huakuii]|uniref:hypothetical protein n=1 Tax=Kurthia huakuii TaxID=1421019 RepID=UPI000495357F|nr:hypothetical protein [Kurthia huakuii]
MLKKRLKTMLIAAVGASGLAFSTPALAETVGSGAMFLPSTTKTYTTHDAYMIPQKNTFSYNYGDSKRERISNTTKGYAYYYTDNRLVVFEKNTHFYIFVPIKFPLTEGKTYAQSYPMEGQTVKWKVTVQDVGGTKKIGTKTYTNVMRLKFDNGDKLLLAKNHGLIQALHKENGAYVTDFKIVDYR